MARTSGHGNPNWTRDEIILALDLFFAAKPKLPSASDARVVELSALLQSLPIYPSQQRKGSFRNPDSVAFKLLNLRALEMGTGKGLSNTSKEDRLVWKEFHERPDEVRRLAAAIKKAHSSMTLEVEDLGAESEDEYSEGRLLFRAHRILERNRKLRNAALQKVRIAHGELTCKACDKKPNANLGNAGEAIFEVHHIRPLADVGETRTKLGDLVVLCADCHRMIHRLGILERIWFSVEEFKGRLGL